MGDLFDWWVLVRWDDGGTSLWVNDSEEGAEETAAFFAKLPDVESVVTRRHPINPDNQFEGLVEATRPQPGDKGSSRDAREPRPR
jgi:hypothetical protein